MPWKECDRMDERLKFEFHVDTPYLRQFLVMRKRLDDRTPAHITCSGTLVV
jgi:hypothetical protein